MVWLRKRGNGKFFCRRISLFECQNSFIRWFLNKRPYHLEQFLFVATLLYIAVDSYSEAFTKIAPIKIFQPIDHLQPPYRSSIFESSNVENSLAKQEDAVVAWLEDDTLPEKDVRTKEDSPRQSRLGSKFQIKPEVIRAGQEKAIRNKQKRSSDLDRKRRQLMFIKEKQREQKRLNRVNRPLPLDTHRIPLSVLPTGMKCRGTCISVTSFGAYIDIGTECDGLLHVGQMYRFGEDSSNNFVQHPKQIVQPGDEIVVTIRSVNPSRKKLHLTLLPWEIVEQQLEAEQVAKTNDEDARIAMTDRMTLSDVEIDDELWGEIRRVTDFGAYVEIGAVVDGFLHYMDHPSFSGGGQHPTQLMERGDRIRIWVADVDRQRNRIKLTAQRPPHLPGPRREL